MRSDRVDRLVLNYARGFREPDLEFLRGLPIRGLSILSYTVTDLSPIYALADTLTDLAVGRSRGPLDLQRLPHLRKLSTDWSSIHSTVQFAGELDDLYLAGYRPHDLHPLSHLTQLTRLRMKHYPSVRSIDGLQSFSHLEELLIAGARQLADITALNEPTLSGLKTLNLGSCRKIPDLAPIGQRGELKVLNAADCGDLPTLAPLADLTRLEELYLYESTNVLDGDLTPIAQLPALRELAMMNRRHYRPSVHDVKESLPHH